MRTLKGLASEAQYERLCIGSDVEMAAVGTLVRLGWTTGIIAAVRWLRSWL